MSSSHLIRVVPSVLMKSGFLHSIPRSRIATVTPRPVTPYLATAASVCVSCRTRSIPREILTRHVNNRTPIAIQRTEILIGIGLQKYEHNDARHRHIQPDRERHPGQAAVGLEPAAESKKQRRQDHGQRDD